MILSPSAASRCSQLVPFSSNSSLLLFFWWQITALVGLSAAHIAFWSDWRVIRRWGSWWSVLVHLASSGPALIACQCHITATIAVVYGLVQHCGWWRVPWALGHGRGVFHRLHAELILFDQKLRNILLLVVVMLRNILLVDRLMVSDGSVVALQLGELLIGGGRGWRRHKAGLVWRGQRGGLVLQIVEGLKLRGKSC